MYKVFAAFITAALHQNNKCKIPVKALIFAYPLFHKSDFRALTLLAEQQQRLNHAVHEDIMCGPPDFLGLVEIYHLISLLLFICGTC